RNELIARVRTQIRRRRLQERLRETYQRSLSMALTDSLTGLYNRRYLAAHLDGLMLRTEAGAVGPALLAIDVDRFKGINDSKGHAAGDAVLVEIAQRLGRNIRAFDLAARYGGEEFVVVMPETDTQIAGVVAERLRRAIADEKMVIADAPEGIPVSVSIGVAVATAGDTSATLLKRADDALYSAKSLGRNRVVLAPEIAAKTRPALKAV
ncbi:MAG TPA: diguanylate cyclase, partial [Stellaceae bacterium]|nr:diguanylate cyclase [Stellaceae bacterium]